MVFYKRKIDIKACVSIFLSSILIYLLHNKNLLVKIDPTIIKQFYLKFYNQYKNYAIVSIILSIVLYSIYQVKISKKNNMLKYLLSLKPGRFKDSMVIIGIIFGFSFLYQLIDPRVKVKLGLPVVLSIIFIRTFPLQDMPCACGQHGIWYRCGKSFHPDSKTCKQIKDGSKKIMDAYNPLINTIEQIYGILPKELIPNLKIPDLPKTKVPKIPLPGKVNGPRLPSCEFDPFAEARRIAAAARRAALAAARAARRAARAVARAAERAACSPNPWCD